MTFKTHNTKAIDTVGTSLQGQIDIDYMELSNLFGIPQRFEEGKIDARWQIEFEDGLIATIYNYKTGIAYLGTEGKALRDIREWHIGGYSPEALARVQIAIDLAREQAEDKDPVMNAMSDAFAIMESLRAARGEKYAKAVELVTLSRKRGQLFSVLVDVAKQSGAIPAEACESMMKIETLTSAKCLGFIAQEAGIPPSKEAGDELFQWSDKLMAAEQEGAKVLFKDFISGNDRADD